VLRNRQQKHTAKTLPAILKTQDMRNYLLILFTTALLLFSVSCSEKKTTEFKPDQIAFSNSIAMILKSNADAYSKIDEYKKSGQNPYEENNNVQALPSSYNQIIKESEKVSDEFLDYLDSDLKLRYRNLINIYKTILDLIQSGNYNSETVEKIDKEIYSTEESFWKLFEDKQSSFEKKLSGFGQDMKDALKKYNVPVKKDTTDSNKSIWKMILRFILANLVLVVVYLILGSILLFIFRIMVNYTQRITGFVFFSIVIAIILQIYLWTLWSSFCVTTIKYYINSPEVTHSWIYYIVGFLGTVSILFSIEERFKSLKLKSNNNINLKVFEKVKLLIFWMDIYFIFVLIGFIFFCIFPSLMTNNVFAFVNNLIYK
jgi:hypothetical protein